MSFYGLAYGGSIETGNVATVKVDDLKDRSVRAPMPPRANPADDLWRRWPQLDISERPEVLPARSRGDAATDFITNTETGRAIPPCPAPEGPDRLESKGEELVFRCVEGAPSGGGDKDMSRPGCCTGGDCVRPADCAANSLAACFQFFHGRGGQSAGQEWHLREQALYFVAEDEVQLRESANLCRWHLKQRCSVEEDVVVGLRSLCEIAPDVVSDACDYVAPVPTNTSRVVFVGS